MRTIKKAILALAGLIGLGGASGGGAVAIQPPPLSRAPSMSTGSFAGRPWGGVMPHHGSQEWRLMKRNGEKRRRKRLPC